jgi:TetR/AcrR family transcriptional regulator
MEQPGLSPRAERTRRALLDAAETLFSERGFDATRLEDVAERVGIRRASIVYYFKDKRELYDAVLEDVFGGLLAKVRGPLERTGPLPERVDEAVAAWVDYVGRRPSLARILLREVADAAPGRTPALPDQTRPFFEIVQRIATPAAGSPSVETVDAAHFASAIAGATVFFVAAIPALLPGFELDAGRLAAHRTRVLELARHLLREQLARSRASA